jgi:hypothetical protein
MRAGANGPALDVRGRAFDPRIELWLGRRVTIVDGPPDQSDERDRGNAAQPS